MAQLQRNFPICITEHLNKKKVTTNKHHVLAELMHIFSSLHIAGMPTNALVIRNKLFWMIHTPKHTIKREEKDTLQLT